MHWVKPHCVVLSLYVVIHLCVIIYSYVAAVFIFPLISRFPVQPYYYIQHWQNLCYLYHSIMVISIQPWRFMFIFYYNIIYHNCWFSIWVASVSLQHGKFDGWMEYRKGELHRIAVELIVCKNRALKPSDWLVYSITVPILIWTSYVNLLISVHRILSWVAAD